MAAKAGQDALIAAVEQTEAWCKRYREHQTFIKCVVYLNKIFFRRKEKASNEVKNDTVDNLLEN